MRSPVVSLDNMGGIRHLLHPIGDGQSFGHLRVQPHFCGAHPVERRNNLVNPLKWHNDHAVAVTNNHIASFDLSPGQLNAATDRCRPRFAG